MTLNVTTEQLSHALFQTDPANTCCKENDYFDEYDYVAEAIVERMVEGMSLEKALAECFSEWFFGGESFDTEQLNPTLELLREEK
ncbi:hypothetical protein [Marinobacter litoralis]|uniref:hypothetical protein n=1 Tax=Marinobacter litoralis TaxID=187981 RepID=UPI0018EDB158|nr:hypothetical protein [Marinobacter litoralis]MBJ6137966.1 hypothetical protein [Marinobacter litoralis]